MRKAVDFSGKVAIVTGAGNGLGRSHALALGARGARLVVNDRGGERDGTGASSVAAATVAQEIVDAGGEAIANGADVTDFAEVEAMVDAAKTRWGRVDILINNAGILRDKSFAKMSLDDFRLVIEVHLMGTVHCCKAVWETMREQGYGRIVVTTSASGLYGNFGQSNYSAAKMAVVGLMNTLALEGAKYDIRINALAPTAHTRMTEELLPGEAQAVLSAESVTAAALLLCRDEAPQRCILCAGAGGYANTRIYETEGIWLPVERQTPEDVLAQWDAVCDPQGQLLLEHGAQQTERFVLKATRGG